LQQRAREDSPWLIEGARERPVSVETYQATLYGLAGDLPLAEPLTSHRLRHTFATSLMNGGMSLPGIMKLLGHRDHRMTLRYCPADTKLVPVDRATLIPSLEKDSFCCAAGRNNECQSIARSASSVDQTALAK
jgi:integrase